ncbi:MAG: hypothetical protein AAF383_02025 [Cyanobacteria bacterium P01_A01_bin.83]
MDFFTLVRVFSAQHLIARLTDAGFVIDYQWQLSKDKALFVVANKPGYEIEKEVNLAFSMTN